MRRRAALPLLLAATPAAAHDLPAGLGQGLAAVPGPMLLPLLSLGLMAAVARRRAVALAAALGLLIGPFLAPFVGIDADLIAVGAGLACALLAASGLPLAGAGHVLLATATGALTGAAFTGGHGGWLVPPLGLLGLLLGALLSLALPLLFAAPLRARWPGPARVALRVAASWLAAIGILALALTFVGPLP